jgi:cytochrome c peroxidase
VRRASLLVAIVLVAVGAIAAAYLLWPRPPWTSDEVATLRSLWIGTLPPLPPDPSNRVADDPRAVALGKRLFFDSRLSVNGNVACASCHQPALQFQDGRQLARGVGTTTRKTMAIAGTGYSPWLFWDGRKDSQWAQALGPLESPVEHGGTRTQYAHLIAQHYQLEYEALFGPLPQLSDTGRFPAGAGPAADPAARATWERMAGQDREAVTRVYANIGKAIAAYERRILPHPSRFDAYVQAVLKNDLAAMRGALTLDEMGGLRLFIGKAQCINCHNGPLFTDNHFHNTGVPGRVGLPKDVGRAKGALQVRDDEFNCLSPYSDARPDECAELKYMIAAGVEIEGAFKPSSLRNIAATGPYMHAGQFTTLSEVLEHYKRAPVASIGRTELKPLQLTAPETRQLEAFLRSLDGGTASPP